MKRAFWSTSAVLLTGILAAIPATIFADSHEAAGESNRAKALLEAMDLPVAAHMLRQSGMPRQEVNESLRVLRRSEDSRADERASRRSARILRAEAETAREHGPMDGFGAFVRAQVESGVRGQELAQAIREQRQARRGSAPGQARERKQLHEKKMIQKAGAGPKPKKAKAPAPVRERQRLKEAGQPPAGDKAGAQDRARKQPDRRQQKQLQDGNEDTEESRPAGGRRGR